MPNWVANNITMTGSPESISAVLELLRSEKEGVTDEIDFNNVIKMPESLNLVEGGANDEYVALYLHSLSETKRASLAKELSNVPTSFYKTYFAKYAESFAKTVSEERRQELEKSFQEHYAAIKPSCLEDVGKTYIENILNYGADTWYDWKYQNWGTKWGPHKCHIYESGFSFETANGASIPITATLSEMYPDIKFRHEYADEDIGSNCGRYVLENGYVLEKYLPDSFEEAVRFACDVWEYDASEFLEMLCPSLNEQIEQCAAQVQEKTTEGVVEKQTEKGLDER